MKLVSAFSSLLLVAVAPVAAAQHPATGEAPKPQAASKPADLAASIQRAIIKADNAAFVEAIDGLFLSGKEGRAQLRAILDRVRPAAEALPPLEKGAKVDQKAAAEPLNDEMKALVEDLFGKDAAKSEAAAAKLTEAAKTATDQTRKVVTRSTMLFNNYILRVFRDQNESGAIFAGQYTALKELGPSSLKTVSAWVVSPPVRTAPEPLRIQCLKAIRDMVDGQPDGKLLESLKSIANDEFEDAGVQREAKYALSQFGDRSFIDPQIKKLEEQLKGENDELKGDALAELSEIHYQLRDYKSAVETYKKHIGLIEAGKIEKKSVNNMPTVYYNACCSMALAGMTDDAFAYLEKALEEGRKGGRSLTRRLLEVDMDIESLRKDPRFEKLLEKLGGKKKAPAPADASK
jgi:tetratricopeptide (TPR) repeat protein